ncbi:hypothetical protein ASPVEDRAFT_802297 [Aspergillus versicolor CBS 583.65]|uniref:Uncharacterized protein n=1 Tax=Aspergillus versicolor CBS 583.65 TaxID=1036611 RepID=A0A1L9PSV6_ASPVE|nr:uncharacterized protein ASPVEDRAFT_802297 [Aspergillus versicolor CBS 583.65]OJJ04609.1 hypothetical protein ASPVEDRAFT_802297 [Aspergillus versicolor CBS 583.65]
MSRSLSPGRMNMSIYIRTRCTLDAPRRNTTRASRLASNKAEHHCNRPGCIIIWIKHQEFAGPAGSNEHSPPSGNISYHILWTSQLKPALVPWRYSKILGGTASGKFSIGGVSIHHACKHNHSASRITPIVRCSVPLSLLLFFISGHITGKGKSREVRGLRTLRYMSDVRHSRR